MTDTISMCALGSKRTQLRHAIEQRRSATERLWLDGIAFLVELKVHHMGSGSAPDLASYAWLLQELYSLQLDRAEAVIEALDLEPVPLSRALSFDGNDDESNSK